VKSGGVDAMEQFPARRQQKVLARHNTRQITRFFTAVTSKMLIRSKTESVSSVEAM
jgi:hypothetical protein